MSKPDLQAPRLGTMVLSGEERTGGAGVARRLVGRIMFRGDSWAHQVIRGGTWLILGDGLNQIGGLVRIAVLSRLLAPGDFGLLGIAMLVQRWIESFTQTGVSAALIQRRDDITRYLDTAFSLQVIRGTMVAALLLCASYPAGVFFDNSDAPSAIRCLAFATFVSGFANPAIVYLRKELRFGADVSWRLTGTMANLVVGIGAAFWFRNAWALILALVVGRLTETATSYCFHAYRPHFRLVRSDARELMRFGKWITAFNIVTFLDLQIDSILIGKFLGATQLGYYQVAAQFAEPPARLGAHVHGVLFPAYGKLTSSAQCRRAFLATLAVLASVLVPLGCLLILIARPLVMFVLGDRWAPVCAPLQALICATILRAIASSASPVILSLGHSRRVVEIQGLKLILLAAALYPVLTNYGIAGAAIAMAGSSAIATVLQLAVASKLVQASPGDIIRCLVGALVISGFLVLSKVFGIVVPWGLALHWMAALGLYAWVVNRWVRPLVRTRASTPAGAA